MNGVIDPKDPDYCETCGGECVANCKRKCAICGDLDGDNHNIKEGGTRERQHRFTLTRPRFWVAPDVYGWITTHVKLGAGETPEAAALWWLAVKNAELLGDLNTRERADLFIDGIVPLKESDIEDYLSNMHEYTDNYDEEVEADLRGFFKDDEREVEGGQGG